MNVVVKRCTVNNKNDTVTDCHCFVTDMKFQLWWTFVNCVSETVLVTMTTAYLTPSQVTRSSLVRWVKFGFLCCLSQPPKSYALFQGVLNRPHYQSCLSVGPVRAPNSETKRRRKPKLAWTFPEAEITNVSAQKVKVRAVVAQLQTDGRIICRHWTDRCF